MQTRSSVDNARESCVEEGAAVDLQRTCEDISNLRCSGMRNWLGQPLLLRNEEWVNGTMPALCVAFAGSNPDMKPNDRLPIVAAAHAQAC